jgi:hypothetical protein
LTFEEKAPLVRTEASQGILLVSSTSAGKMYGNLSSGWPGTDLGQPLGSNKAQQRLAGPKVFPPDGDRSLQGVGLTWQQGHALGAHIVYSAMDVLDVGGNDVTHLVRTGDRLMEIDGFNVTTHQTAIVEKMVVGERNSVVDMTFESANSGLLYVLEIRRHVPPPPAQAFLDQDDEEQVPPKPSALRGSFPGGQSQVLCRAGGTCFSSRQPCRGMTPASRVLDSFHQPPVAPILTKGASEIDPPPGTLKSARPATRLRGAGVREFISRTVFIKLFKKVNSHTYPSTGCFD